MQRLILAFSLLVAAATVAQEPPTGMISAARPVPTGLAPNMQFKLIHKTDGERVYAIIFGRGDEVISGLTDFATQNHIADAHFTAIGAVDNALLAWFDIPKRNYRPIPITDQSEVLAFTGDIAAFNGKPIVHAHSILSRPDGSVRGGHTFELHVNPTLEVFLTADDTPLGKSKIRAVSNSSTPPNDLLYCHSPSQFDFVLAVAPARVTSRHLRAAASPADLETHPPQAVQTSTGQSPRRS